ncbi:MAG TPA: hypothetical protein EYH54_01990 [Nautiliaceae bacterium]|nr:hypothetical protein [Nautiliaceae bacterium]
MKVLIIGLNKERLSYFEFVKPLEEQLINKGYKVFYMNYRSFIFLKNKRDFLKNFCLVILSGTALKDYNYLYFWRYFLVLKHLRKKTFGICAGAQILALISKIKILKLKKKIIGQYYIKNKKRFFLSSFLFLINNKKAYSFKIGKFKGVAYHPEVYEELVEEIHF